MKKILAIDIGNSNIVLGLFEGSRLRKTWRFVTGAGAIHELPVQKGVSLDGIVVASVVPSLDRALKKLLKKKFGCRPIFVSSRIRLPIRLSVKKPAEVGADRIANAVGAHQEKGGGIVIDFGTATTFDVISEKREYLGGPIIPGLGICAQALHEKTTKLPLVKIKKPSRVIGKETVECIQAGLYYGYAGMVDCLVEKIQKEYGKKMKVVATGGLASLITKECKTVEANYPFLTLKGLKIIYDYHAQRTF